MPTWRYLPRVYLMNFPIYANGESLDMHCTHTTPLCEQVWRSIPVKVRFLLNNPVYVFHLTRMNTKTGHANESSGEFLSSGHVLNCLQQDRSNFKHYPWKQIAVHLRFCVIHNHHAIYDTCVAKCNTPSIGLCANPFLGFGSSINSGLEVLKIRVFGVSTTMLHKDTSRSLQWVGPSRREKREERRVNTGLSFN